MPDLRRQTGKIPASTKMDGFPVNQGLTLVAQRLVVKSFRPPSTPYVVVVASSLRKM